MKIGIEATAAVKKLGGVSEYTYNLIKALAKIDQKNDYELVNFSFFRGDLEEFPELPPNFKIKNINIPNKILNFFWNNFNWLKLDYFLPDCDVIFCPNFLVPPTRNRDLIFTVHDLSFLHFPNWFLKEDQIKFKTALEKNLPRAKKIIAVSKNTKKDLVEILKVNPEKIAVTPLAADEIFHKKLNSQKQIEVLAEYKILEPYILYLGTLEPRKNVSRLVEAFANLSKKFPKLNLVLAGRKGWLYEEIFQKVRDFNLSDKVIFTDTVAKDERPYLYAGAEVFVYPSLFEGFGLPPLEAMACGAPVVTSNLSSIPEVVGKAALFIDPYNVEEISLVIEKILKNPRLRADLIKKGKIQAKKFSWEKTAEKTLEVFR